MVAATDVATTSGKLRKRQLRQATEAAAGTDELAWLRAAAHADEVTRSLRWASAV